MEDGKCLVQLYGAEGLYFLGRSREYTDNIQDALIFLNDAPKIVYHSTDKMGIISKNILGDISVYSGTDIGMHDGKMIPYTPKPRKGNYYG